MTSLSLTAEPTQASTLRCFRLLGLDDFEVWRRLLHHYYDPFPTVEHLASSQARESGVPLHVARVPIAMGRGWGREFAGSSSGRCETA